MKKLLTLIFVLAATPAWALSLNWTAVTTDATGTPLSPGMAVTQYKIYKCNTPAASCLKAGATVIGTVNAPVVKFDITSQPVPASYFVTAVNLVTESPESATVKVVPPDLPKNVDIQNP